MKKVPRLAIICVISLIVLIAGIIALSYSNTNNSEGITALEGKEYADDIAREWNESAIFVGAGSSLDVNNNGDAQYWGYTYQNCMDGNGTDLLSVKIYSNYSYEMEIIWSPPPSSTQGIESWTIDSNTAFNIALNNSDIKSFLNNGAKLDMCYLKGTENQVAWYIYWAYDAGFDDPKWAQIRIDATTGGVLYVDVDN